MPSSYISTFTLLLVILNPFALSVYLVDVLQGHALASVTKMLVRALFIAAVVMGIFAVFGERLFTDVLHVRFFAFQVFGGIVFLIIGLKFILDGSGTMTLLRGEPAQLAGAVAMPFLIGPGTVSASALAGARHGALVGPLVVVASLASTGIILIFLKLVFDRLKTTNAALLERYTEVAGRVSGFLAGSISVEMIASGLETWIGGLGGT
jgi:small neutral amino acid transporter SnatA (MarC family)